MIKKIFLIAILIISLLVTTTSYSQKNKKEEMIKKNKIENQKCFKCHGQDYYVYNNPEIERDIRKRMHPDRIVLSDGYYLSNHKTFKCINCHSDEYEEFPHPGELRMEEKYTCLDCHGDDEDWAKYEFEKIYEEFAKSIHSNSFNESFSCWMCHNPHTDKNTTRISESLDQTVSYSNNICLSCHADAIKYMLFSENDSLNIVESHEWLTNREAHFLKVRCIECHTEIRGNVFVEHNILGKEKAVKNCIECHSENSILLKSLYKHKIVEGRKSGGFLNSDVFYGSYVIGANRNKHLANLSLGILILTIGGIFIHSLLRIFIIKK